MKAIAACGWLSFPSRSLLSKTHHALAAEDIIRRCHFRKISKVCMVKMKVQPAASYLRLALRQKTGRTASLCSI